MQYEVVILELMTRIKKLEDDVEAVKQQMALSSEEPLSSGQPKTNESTATYRKMTDEMTDLCYRGGKRVFAGEKPADVASEIAAQSGMNQNSAIMYLYAVDAMMQGTVYKRAINAKALRRYFDSIYSEYGNAGLKRAIRATRLHIAYRRDCGHQVDSIEAICDDYKARYQI